ncbi:MAG: extracellular solute-binding protein [Succinivibrio sp.]|nr:extracellular solute-binding protein [Succinivibrio sp.]
MKKVSKLSIAVTLAVGFAGVVSAADLTVWEDIQKSQGINNAVVDFEKQFNVSVDIKEMPYTGQIEKVRLDGPAGIGPDVMLIPHDQMGAAVVQGLITPLEFMQTDKGNYTDSSVQAFTTGGKIYGCPKVVESVVMFYNQDMLPKPLATMDEYYDYSKKVHDADKNKYGLLAKWDSVYYAYGALRAYGAYVFKRDAGGDFDVKDLGLSNQGAIDAVTYMKKFYTDGLFPVGIVGDNGGNAIDSLFTEKKAAAVITGPWNLEPYANAGINYGVSPLPKMPNGQDMSSFMGVKGYVVSTWAKDHALAEKFLQFINQPKYVVERYEATKEIPPVKAVMEDKVIKDDPIASAIAVQASRAEPMPSIPEMGEVWGPIDAALQLCMTGKQDVKEALTAATDHIKSQIEAFRADNQ